MIMSLAGEWLSEYPREHTRRAYQHDLEAFFVWCAKQGLDPAAAARSDANSYREELLESLAPKTVDRRLAACRSFYRFCVAAKALGSSPFDSVRRAHRPGESQTPWLDRDELRRLLQTAEKVDPTGRDVILVSLLGLNGLRISEALGADVSDLGASGGHRTLRIARKGEKAGLVPLAPSVEKRLDSYLGNRDKGPLIVRLNGRAGILRPVQPISREGAAKRLRRLAELAEVNPEISPHSLRRSFVTLALQSGAPLHQVQDAAGHASPITTQTYNRARFNLDDNPTFGLADSLLERGADDQT